MATLTDALTGGYLGGAAMQQATQEARVRPEQLQAETSLLSTRAEAAKLSLAEEKDAFRTRLATRAALSKAQQANANQDLSSIQGQLKVMDDAIKATDDPEVKQSFFKQKQGLISDQARITLEQGKVREDERAQTLETAGEILARGPEGADDLIHLGLTSDNRLLYAAGRQMKDEVPVYMFGNKMYSQLSEDEKAIWKSSIGRALEPKAGEATIRNAAREAYEQQLLSEKQREADLKHQAEMARVAAQREKTAVDAKTKQAKAETAIPIQLSKLETAKANDVNKLKKEQSALLIKAGMPAEGVTTEGWFSTHHTDLPPEIKSAYEGYNTAIKAREDAHERAKAALVGAPKVDVQMKASVEKQGWTYEPDKYDYRVTAEGKVQRKKKG